MNFRTLQLILGLAVTAAALIGCSQKTDTAAEKAATDVKDKVVADAKAAEALVKEKEAQETGIDAYIYAYPLVTMELTRRRFDQRGGAGRQQGADGPVRQAARLSGCR